MNDPTATPARQVTRPLAVTRRWRCQIIAGSHGQTARGWYFMASTPHSALVWLRVELRVLLHVFDAKGVQRALDWLELGQWEAIAHLRAGQQHIVEVRSDQVMVEWSARPVLLLPLVPRPPGLRTQPTLGNRIAAGSHSIPAVRPVPGNSWRSGQTSDHHPTKHAEGAP
ncbi:hypothetical protein [Streptomyces mayteni]